MSSDHLDPVPAGCPDCDYGFFVAWYDPRTMATSIACHACGESLGDLK